MSSFDLDQQAIARTVNGLIDDHLRAGRTFCFTLSTSSMRPELAPGDKVYVRAAPTDELRPGDIVVRRMDENLIAHRLIGRASSDRQTLFVTKGDNALMADTPWPEAQLVGVIVAVERARQRQAVRLARSTWRAAMIARLSRGQLLAGRIKPNICRRMAIKLSRVGLRAAVRLAP